MSRVPAGGGTHDPGAPLLLAGANFQEPGTAGDWGRRTFCDPCHGCGHDWSLPAVRSIALVVAVPDRMVAVLDGCGGHDRHPDLAWSSSEYVGHVIDNLRIWSERLEAATAAAITATPATTAPPRCQAPEASLQ